MASADLPKYILRMIYSNAPGSNADEVKAVCRPKIVPLPGKCVSQSSEAAHLHLSGTTAAFTFLIHQISELIGFGWLHRPVPDVKYANRLGLTINGEVDLIAAMALAVE